MRQKQFCPQWLCMALVFGALLPYYAAFAQAIVLNGIDVKSKSTPLTAESLQKSGFSEEPALVLVQFSGPIQPQWLDDLKATGATIHHFIADYAFLVTLKPNSLEGVKRAGNVSWVGRIPASAKLNSALAAKIANTVPDKMGDITVEAVVLSYSEFAAKTLEAQGHRIKADRETIMGWHETRVDLALSEVMDVAAINDVFCIEEAVKGVLGGERAAQTAAGQYEEGATAPFGPGYTAWLGAEGLSGGDNIIVNLFDSGLDQGIATNLPGTAHLDILGRIVGIFNTTSDPDGANRSGHGQLDAAIIMGNASAGTVDKGGYLLGQGVAPTASVYATKIYRDAGGNFDLGTYTFTELTQLAQNAGANFSNNSWGFANNGAYNSGAAEFDALVRDSDPDEAGNQQTSHFFCAGNDGPDNGTTWTNAKNIVSVGSHENSDADGYDGGISGPTRSDNIRDVYPSSSRGPTADGRLGVTVVATGSHVQGAAPTVEGYTGANVSSKYWPTNQTDYCRSTGTSHACPVACGAGIIVYEMFRDQLSAFGHTNAPSPALIRAVLTNTATDLVGGSDGNGGVLTNIPNVHQGWGAVNLETLASLKTSLYSQDQSHVFTASGQDFEVTLSPMIADLPIKITLAWTDVPGVPGAATELVNDLDLRVIQNGQTFKGNVFNGGFSDTGGNADRKNTLEAVFIEDPIGGPVTVRVTAFNVAGDGVPNSGGVLDQDFALFAWNTGVPDSTGNVQVFPADINCNTTVTFNLRDKDLAGDGDATVAVSSSKGDAETVTLNETGASTGLFTGSIATDSGAAAANGVLEVANDGTITVTYNDASNSSAQPAVDEESALVDCTPPVVSNVQITNITSKSALISYSTNGPCDSKVLFGMTCGALTQFRGGGLHAVDHYAHLTGLTESTTYRFKIESTDSAGNTTTADDGGSCFNFATTARRDYFSEWFFDNDNDLANQTLLFTPDGSVSYYSACRTAATTFPTDPSAHTNLSSTVGLKGDSSYEIALTGGKEFSFYGTIYTGFHVNANGNITFGIPDESAIETLYKHDAIPRISGLFDDLAPTNQKPVRYLQLADRAVVTWDAVPEDGIGGSNSFQIELFFDGRIQLTHLNIDAIDGLAGLSRGLGTQSDLVLGDLSAYLNCNAAQTGSVRVTIKPKGARQDGARWRLDGGAWTKSGKSISGVSVGNHTVQFKSISGWQRPSNKQANVTAGNESSLNGKYNIAR